MTDKILLALLVVLVAFLIWLGYIAAISPSCADRGGKEVFSHFQTVVTRIGETTVVNQLPVYRCDLDR